ncbi:MAG: hypothetical protein H0V24_09835 [Chloroflexia bacterium]|nr:hypothetical protein [Chloroflexia bacterium]
MSVETSTASISETELSEHLTEVLDRVANGERIIIQREGKVLAVIEPSPYLNKWTWGDLVRFLNETPIDEELARIIREIHDEQPIARHAEWPE